MNIQRTFFLKCHLTFLPKSAIVEVTLHTVDSKPPFSVTKCVSMWLQAARQRLIKVAFNQNGARCRLSTGPAAWPPTRVPQQNLGSERGHMWNRGMHGTSCKGLPQSHVLSCQSVESCLIIRKHAACVLCHWYSSVLN